MKELNNIKNLLKEEKEEEGKYLSDICKEKECCCKCRSQFRAVVCNCSGEWEEKLFLRKSKINGKHGDIGWACIVFAEEGVVDISRNRHGLCGEFSLKTTRKINMKIKLDKSKFI
jgi:hypothetical protein